MNPPSASRGSSMTDSYSMGRKYERPRHKGLKTIAIVTALMAITIVPALAAKGGAGGKGHGGSTGGTTGGGTIAGPNVMNETDGLVDKGDQVTFTFSTTA